MLSLCNSLTKKKVIYDDIFQITCRTLMGNGNVSEWIIWVSASEATPGVLAAVLSRLHISAPNRPTAV